MALPELRVELEVERLEPLTTVPEMYLPPDILIHPLLSRVPLTRCHRRIWVVTR